MKIFSIMAALSGFSWVLIGAIFGHEVLNPYQESLFHKAQFYQIIHSIMIIVICQLRLKCAGIIAVTWLLGIVCFSGRLYLMAVLDFKTSLIIPVGGLLYLLGWLLTCFGLLFSSEDKFYRN